MRWFLYAFGIYYIAVGVWLILYTEGCRRIISQITTEKYMKPLSIVAGLVGVLLILAASHSRNSWFVVLIGVLGVLKCLMFLFGPRKISTGLLAWFADTSDQTWRLWGIIALVLGTAITSWVI